MKKLVLKLDLHDDKDKSKALKMVTTVAGVDSISMDMKGKKLTVIGTVDPVKLVSKLRKSWAADFILVGPAKEPEKKEEPKKEEPNKEEPKKEEPKKEEPKKEEPKKEEEAKKEEPKKEEEKELAPVVGIMPYRAYYYASLPSTYYPPLSTYRYANHSMEENPSACVTCWLCARANHSTEEPDMGPAEGPNTIGFRKLVLKLDLHDDEDKSKALKMVTTLAGIDSISMDMKGKKLTVVGTVDPVKLVGKLRKFWAADIILVGLAKEPEKKEEPKKEEPKKEEPKKEEPKKEEEKKELAPVVGIMPDSSYYYPPLSPYRFANHSMEEIRSACVIC